MYVVMYVETSLLGVRLALHPEVACLPPLMRDLAERDTRVCVCM